MKATSDITNIRPDVKQRSVASVIWDGIRAPLIAGLIMVLAALWLINLQAQRTDFDKKQKAPFILVDDGKKVLADKDSRPVSVNALIASVGTLLDNKGDGDQSFDAAGIIKKSAAPLSLQTFKDKDELINNLIDGVQKQKRDQTRLLQSYLEKARVADNEIREQSIAARTELASILGHEPKMPVDIAHVLDNASDNGPLKTALKQTYPQVSATNVTSLEPPEVERSVDSYFENLRKSKTRTLCDGISGLIEKVENRYLQLGGAIYDKLADPEVFHRISPPIVPATGLALIMDENRGIGVLYTILRITLVGIVLFALLYLVLIPLKHLFFWTTAGDVLTEQIKKLLDKSTPTIGPLMMRAALVGVGAVGVGTAVLIAGPPASPSPPPSTTSDHVRLRDRSDDTDPDNAGAGRPGDTYIDRTQLNLDDLRDSVDLMTLQINDLENTVLNFKPAGTVLNADPEFAKAVNRLVTDFNNKVGDIGDSSLSHPDTLFGKLNEMPSAFRSEFASFKSNDFTPFSGNVNRQFSSLNALIKNDTLPTDPSTVFGKFSKLQDTLGTREKDDQTVVVSLRDLTSGVGTSDRQPGSPSLFAQLRSAEQSVTSLSNTAKSIRGEQLSLAGRNFVNRSKSWFRHEQYRVSTEAVAEISNQFGIRYPRVLAELNKLIRERTYSESEIHNAILKVNGGYLSWEELKPLIRKWMRVPRF